MTITVVKPVKEDINELSYLLNSYRLFYKQSDDLNACYSFLKARLQDQDSVIFYAKNQQNNGKSKPAGFIQLYPVFTTVGLKRLWLLNDLYVDERYRNQGVATLLLKEAEKYAKYTNASGLILETANDNRKAQQLYEKLGWKKDLNHQHYYLSY